MQRLATITVKTRMKHLQDVTEEVQGHPKTELVRQLCSGPTRARAEDQSKRDEIGIAYSCTR